jgi:hypothetical protein
MSVWLAQAVSMLRCVHRVLLMPATWACVLSCHLPAAVAALFGTQVSSLKFNCAEYRAFLGDTPALFRPQPFEATAIDDGRTATLHFFSHPSLLLSLYCRMTEKPPAIEGSPGSNNEYPVALKCSDTSSPPKGERVRATGVEVWFEQQWSGLHLLECELEKAR